jgi:hypothetical protein
MSIKTGRIALAAAVLGSMLGATIPAWADGHGGGGGHFSGGGGGHFSGGGGGHFAGGGGHFSGGGHFAGGAGHFAGGGHGGATIQSYSGNHFAGGGGAHFAGGGTNYAAGYRTGGGHGYAGYNGGFHHGYSTGAYWRGGYWRGGYWPRSYYGVGFNWYLPFLPALYATYWYGGLPYYYANDVYYTWNPSYDGYTATDPPPLADNSAPSPQGDSESGSAQIFMYPKNGQSEEQQSTDRRECQQWAGAQAGQDGANAPDYRRAMIACVEGRGYSAK